jgi:ankyrin repeat protein
MKAGVAAMITAVGIMLGSSNVAVCGPIHDAAAKGKQATVVALLKENSDLVNSRDKFGNTSLHVAVKHNRVGIAEVLLANGADVNARNTDVDRVPRRDNAGETPLTLALLSYEHREMMELLLTHGADANVMLSQGNTPLHRAVERDLPYDVELLLANGADPNPKGLNWETPVLTAVLHDHMVILKLLLDYGADPNPIDMAGRTPMFYANLNSRLKAIELLKEHGGHT